MEEGEVGVKEGEVGVEGRLELEAEAGAGMHTHTAKEARAREVWAGMVVTAGTASRRWRLGAQGGA